MKRMMILLLAVLMLLMAGCGQKAEITETQATATETQAPETEPVTEPPTEPPTEAPTEPVPTVSGALVQTDGAPAVLMLLHRGDTVDVVGEYDEDHYAVKTEQGYGLVEKQLLRSADAEPYEVWTGYAYGNTAVYSHYQLTGEAVMTLSLNKTVEVLEELKYTYLVAVEDTLGFVLKDNLSRSQIRYSGGGSSGGADGGDIVMRGPALDLLFFVEQTGEVTGTAQVIADNTPVVLGYFERDSYAPVVLEEGFAPAWEGYYTLYIEGIYAYLPKYLAAVDGETYASWECYAGYNAVMYDNYLLLGEGNKISTNKKAEVIWDGGAFLVIRYNDQIGYVAKDEVGTSRYATGGGGSSGGDWTPPAM